ncbi:MAG: RidA family protein [Hydrococcus sp. Prado102]|jgi:enamine deaminase RidA (YjgF/YER057c/UK114 family)|nr:RidA family protein [Hydrococcus sp. Prado102]
MVKDIQRINPTELYDPSPNGYTHVIVVPPGATLVYIAGQGGEDENGNLVDDFASQLKQAFSNLRIALNAAGARPEHVVKLTTLIVGHNETTLQQLSTQVQEIWGDRPPTQTLIPVSRLALDRMLFEVEAIAAILNS